MRTNRGIFVSVAVLAVLGLSGCAGGSSELCTPLKESGAGASLFNPYVAWGSGTGEVDQRLAAMDAAGEPTGDIEDAWNTWRDHLEAIREVEESGDSPAELIAETASGDAADAGSELSSFYTDTCL